MAGDYLGGISNFHSGNSFTSSGYYYEDGIVYSGETESESDCDEIIHVLLLSLWFPSVYLKHSILHKMGSRTRQTMVVFKFKRK